MDMKCFDGKMSLGLMLFCFFTITIFNIVSITRVCEELLHNNYTFLGGGGVGVRVL